MCIIAGSGVLKFSIVKGLLLLYRLESGSENLDSEISDSDEEEEEGISNEEASLISKHSDKTGGDSKAGASSLEIPTLPLPINTQQPEVSTDTPSSSQANHTHSPSSSQPLESDAADGHTLRNDSDAVMSGIDQPNEPLIAPFCYEDFDFDSFSSVEELEKIGGDGLKVVLQNKGLKCGGTPQERAHRLWSVKGKTLDEIDPSLLAGKGRSRNKGKKK